MSRRRRIAIGLLGALAGCYAPQARTGAPCDPAIGNCPAGQACTAAAGGYVCAAPGTVADAPAIDVVADTLSIDGPPPDAACGDLASGLLARWRFDEGAGTTTADASGNGHDGTVDLATWTTGKVLGALAFDGTASRVIVPASALLRPTEAVSYGAWIKTAGVDYGFVIDRQKLLWTSYALQIVGNGAAAKARCIVGYDATATGHYDVDSAPIGDNMWHYVACTYDRNRLRVYLDGVLSGSIAATNAIYYDGIAPFYVGFHFEANSYFTGSVDDASVYDRRLLDCELQALANP